MNMNVKTDFLFQTVLVLSLLAATVNAQHPSSCRYTYDHEVLNFIMIADVHMGENLAGGDQDSEYLGWVVDYLMPACGPSVVAVDGDITDGSNGWFWPSGGPYQDEWLEYREVLHAQSMNPNVWLDMPGNHDSYGDGDVDFFLDYSIQGTATGFRQSSLRKNFGFGSYHFVSSATCQNVDLPWPSDLCGLDDEELNFIDSAFDNNSDCDLTFLFGHHPTGNFLYGEDEILEMMLDYHISLYGYGHTHEFDSYWRNLTLTINVDSLGKGDNDQFALFAVDGNGLSASGFDVMDSPYVMITAPVDVNLGGDHMNEYTYPVPHHSSANPVRALAFTVPGGSNLTVLFRVDGGAWSAMVSDPDYDGLLWEGFFDGTALSYGDHTVEVQAVSSSNTKSDTVTFVVRDTACTDGIDNDGDGATDMDDCGCPDALDNDESDCNGTPTPTPSNSPTLAPTKTWTPTPSVTETPTRTPTNTRTSTRTFTPSRTPTPIVSATVTQTPTRTPTTSGSNTSTRTSTPTGTPTSSTSGTATRTPEASATPYPTIEPSGTPVTGEAHWPKFRFNRTNTGCAPQTGPMDNALEWMFDTTGTVESSPAIDSEGNIYIGCSDKAVYSIRPDGSLRWKYTTGNWIRCSPTIDENGTIYIGSIDRNLYALNPNGSLRWSYQTGYWIRSSPAIGADGTIYFGSADNFIYALNSDGGLRWRYETAGWVESSPAIAADGTIYIGSSDHYLYAMNPDGSLKWRYLATRGIDSSPAVGSDGVIYFGCDDYSLYAISPSGDKLWQYQTQGGIESSPAIGEDGRIYFGSRDRALYALSSSGALVWKHQTNGGIESSPIIDGNGTIYVGSNDRSIYAFNHDGELLWKRDIGYYIKSSPALSLDGTLYIGSNDFYAIGQPENLIKPDLQLNQVNFTPGDLFQLDLNIINQGPSITVQLFIVLEIPIGSESIYWYWPTWTTDLNYQERTLISNQNTVENLLLFVWPAGAGYYSGLRFWSAFLDPTSPVVIGETDMVEWSYSE